MGGDLASDHPVVRTNPITGWKSIFPVGTFPKSVNGLTRRESDNLLKYFHDLITYGHDLQVRFKWDQPNDIGMPFLSIHIYRERYLTTTAIWDNRSVFHTATFDYDGIGERSGNRAVGIGEAPYFDPGSKSRREDLGIEDHLNPVHW